jgi:hypothetical protein
VNRVSVFEAALVCGLVLVLLLLLLLLLPLASSVSLSPSFILLHHLLVLVLEMLRNSHAICQRLNEGYIHSCTS